MIKALVLGFTRSEPERGYSSFMDGFQPDAMQDVVTVFLDVNEFLEPEQMAELAWHASNCPGVIDALTLAGRIQRAIYPYDVRPLSIGDTVGYSGKTVAFARDVGPQRIERN